MKKIIITYGLVSGAVIIGSIILSLVVSGGASEHIAGLEWLGYAVMIIAFSVIFVAIKRYRDTELGGVIRFGTGALVGIGVTLVASVVYVVSWEISLAMTDYAFIEQYTASAIDAKIAAGASESEVAELRAEMETLKTQYANPVYRVPITFLEIFPVGLLISLISAAVLRNSKVLPASNA